MSRPARRLTASVSLRGEHIAMRVLFDGEMIAGVQLSFAQILKIGSLLVEPTNKKLCPWPVVGS